MTEATRLRLQHKQAQHHVANDEEAVATTDRWEVIHREPLPDVLDSWWRGWDSRDVVRPVRRLPVFPQVAIPSAPSAPSAPTPKTTPKKATAPPATAPPPGIGCPASGGVPACGVFPALRRAFEQCATLPELAAHIISEHSIELMTEIEKAGCTVVEHVARCLGELAQKRRGGDPFVRFDALLHQWIWIGDKDDTALSIAERWFCTEEYQNPTVPSSKRRATPQPSSLAPSTLEEVAEFRAQETDRYAHPRQPYTYRWNGHSVVVAPLLKPGGNDRSAVRKNAVLRDDRPPHASLLTLTRDAVARLPNCQGTRGDVVERLQDSQYIVPGLPVDKLHQIVSGTLDRLSDDNDPCVRYQVNGKLWIYLHGDRTEENFASKAAKAATSDQKKRKASTDPSAVLPNAVPDEKRGRE